MYESAERGSGKPNFMLAQYNKRVKSFLQKNLKNMVIKAIPKFPVREASFLTRYWADLSRGRPCMALRHEARGVAGLSVMLFRRGLGRVFVG
jgi:hypothetical protein